MSLIYILNNLAAEKVKRFGAQYNAFAIFGMLNYPLAYLFEYYAAGKFETDDLIFRSTGFLLSILLYYFNNYSSKSRSTFLPLLWYVTVIISIPLLATYMLLKSHFSIGWLINYNIGILIVILLFDWLSFVIIELIGVTVGVAIFIAINGIPNVLPKEENLSLFFYLFFCIVIIAPIFSRNRELFNLHSLKDKDLLNKLLEDKVNMRTQELTAALSVKTEFLNNISHEIRTPISGFSMTAETLVEHWERLAENERREMAKVIAKSAGRIKNLAMHLIDATKFQGGEQILNFQKVNLTQLIYDIIDEAYMLYIADKHVEIKFHSDRDYYAKADPEAILQVLRNILTNAIKFSPTNSVIEIKIEHEGINTTVIVTDEGVGIPEEELEQIFAPFYQSSRTKTGAGGVGLGLNISKQIIIQHQGKIWAKNNVGKGASIIFSLESVETKDRPSTETLAKTILIIDDEELLLESLYMSLSASGLTVLTASSGAQGLSIIEQQQQEIDVILLDIMMPGMDGIEVLKEITNKWPQLKVIMHSGIAGNEEIEMSKKLGAHSFIKKPYKIKELLELISNC